MGDEGALLLPAAPELTVGRDAELRYVPDPELYYLTGCVEPEAVALLSAAREDGPYTLFVRTRDPEAELWSGPRRGPEAAREAYGADAAHPVEELGERLRPVLERVETLYYRLGGGRSEVDATVLAGLAFARRQRPRKGRGVRALVDPGAVLDDLRLVKDAWELGRIREACAITVDAFREAAGVVRPGVGEWQVEAALEAAFRRRGASGPAFPTIVATGPNACVLHYTANDRTLAAGELLLLDAGARLDLYAADVSRTLPVSGRFTAEQRALYEVVREAHHRALETARAGSTEAEVHDAAVGVLLRGLVAAGLLEGDAEELAQERERWRPLYPHRTSHWLGLDVHDVGDYARRGEPRRLEPGMVLTVEPGLYISPDHDAAPPELRGTGIRIEDDVLVTESGREVLTGGLPSDAAGVEGLLRIQR